jgi:hypothetical protein
MVSKIRVPSVSLVEIVEYTPGEFILISAMIYAVSLLDDEVAIKELVLTCIACRLSAAFRCPSWRQGIRFR